MTISTRLAKHVPKMAGNRNGRAIRLIAVAVALLTAAVTAYIVVQGSWYMVLGLMLAFPAFIVVHRYPLAGVMIWLFLMPFLVDDDGGLERRFFWLVHRLLPVAVVLIIVVATRLGLRSQRLPRLGWPEAMMAGYVVVTLLSIIYLSETDRALYDLYDRVVIPMALYLIVRLLEPDERQLRRFLPVLVFIAITQTVIGIISWAAPSALPSHWLDRAGTRTTGSLRAVAVYGTTMIFAGLLLIHAGFHAQRRRTRSILIALAFAALFMVFMTFSRASWIAGIAAFAGTAFIYRRLLRSLILVVVPVLILTIALGGLDQSLQIANQRFLSESSEQTAFSRLPVAVASVRMFQERPIWGFGYGNFDLYDRQYQGAVAGLVVPEKDHASHNLYLTLLAEQGLMGLIAFVGPALWWLSRARSTTRRLPREGVWSRQLYVILWLVLLSHVVVNNFSNMRVVFGLGLWWLTLGLIAAMTSAVNRQTDPGSEEIRPGTAVPAPLAPA